MASWAGGIAAITLFVADLERAKTFYTTVFDVPVHFEDPESAVFAFGDTLVNLLVVDAAPELISPAVVANPAAGNRFQLTIDVADVDAICEHLRSNGIALLNGPMDRPWGPRTACFQDPDGHLWEVAS